MANELFHDDVLLDRLVDGELTGDERRRLLESLDERPEGWRRCALAFLEAQTWREEFGQIARVPRLAIDETSKTVSPNRTSSKSKWAESFQWMAVAATVLIAFGLGWMQHGRGVRVVHVPVDANAPIVNAVPAPPNNSLKPGKVDDAITMYVRDGSGRMQPVQVPLVDAGTLDKELGVKFQPSLSDAMRNQLQNRGFNVQSKQRYAPLWFEKDGPPMIVPVEDTKIVPVSNPAF